MSNVSFFRNPEIKKSLLFFSILTFLATGISFIYGNKCGIFTFILCLMFILSHFIITYKRYTKIAQLSNKIDKILHGKDFIDLNEYSEGELSILQDEVQKLIIRLKEQAEMLKKEKVYLADSLADISHQIRTPLTSINILLSLLSKKELPYKKRQELVNETEMLLSRIEWLISALLKISRLDAGTVTLQRKTVLVSELIKLSIASIAIPLELREQQIEVNINGDETYKGDLSWSVEAIGNIIKNCMENTQKGGKITIQAEENPIYTEIVISDNGPGIDREDLPHLFKRFYKGKNAGSHSVGIGLALARTIIANQNGTVKAENKMDGGAKFTVRFYKQTI